MSLLNTKRRIGSWATAIGLAAILGTTLVAPPSFAGEWHGKGHKHGHWDHGRHRGHHRHDVVIERRREVIVRERPVYVAPPPPVYYAPSPGYYSPGFQFFLHLD